MEPAWDFETLRALFASRFGEDVQEIDLLKTFFPQDSEGNGVLGLELFQKHFLLYRRLWLFDDELRTTTGERLWIRGVRSTLIPAAPQGRCARLDLDTGQYCLDPAEPDTGLCPRHSGPQLEPNSMKSYYLNWSNLEGMTEQGLHDLVENFFHWLGNRGAITEALERFGLPPDSDGRAIKKQWRRLCLDHHPDRGGDPLHFQKLSAAWAILKTLD